MKKSQLSEVDIRKCLYKTEVDFRYESEVFVVVLRKWTSGLLKQS